MQRPTESVAPRRFLTDKKPKWYPSYDLTVGTLTVEVTRKRVTRIYLRVRSDGSVAMSVPWQTNRKTAQAFLDAHEDWLNRSIHRALAKRRPEFEEGAIPLWGRLVELPKGTSPEELYRSEVARVLPGLVKTYEEACDLHAKTWQLKDMSSRWGSCSPATARISINTHLAAFPQVCLEYVIAHELTHLIEPSHNQRFHLHLALVFPHDERQVRALLRKNPYDLARELQASQPGQAEQAGAQTR